ncbi:MAG: MBOAT family protein, partial [Salibacteraceae bacterium]|nr:MBOAT family protein [Salibacteraceae bacterium]
MIFNSLEFIVFALLFFLIWPFAKRENNAKWAFITAMSFVFYGWWDWRFLFLIIGSGLIDYVAGLWIVNRPKHRKLFLVLSLAGNLGSLSVFKYSTFFAEIIDSMFALSGIKTELTSHIPEFALILPVGISFYTFQSMSYTIDVYRGRLQPTENILHFFSYLSMFPQLVAGPIVRAKDLLVQLEQ